MTRGFVPHIAARCGDPAKIAIFMNGADLAAFTRTGDGDEVKRKLGLEGKFVGAYVGTHGMAHGLDTILDAAEILKGEPRFAFLMAGGGAEEARLRAARDARRLDNVVMLGQRPKAEMPGLWSATDASLILLKRSDTFKTVYPSKMSEAMAMQCPIILGVEGEAKEVLQAAGAGVAITPESARRTRRRDARDRRRSGTGRVLRPRRARLCRSEPRPRQGRRALPRAAARSGGAQADQRTRARPPKRALDYHSRVSPLAYLDRARKSFAFARHIPPRRALRRVVLTLKRALRDRVGGRAQSARAAAARGRPAAAVVCASDRHG